MARTPASEGTVSPCVSPWRGRRAVPCAGRPPVARMRAQTKKSGAGGRVSAYRVSIDIGGTFTDCVVSDGARLAVVKAPSTPPAFERGFLNALALAAQAFDTALPDFLARTARIVHGTTVATNALVEGAHRGGRADLQRRPPRRADAARGAAQARLRLAARLPPALRAAQQDRRGARPDRRARQRDRAARGRRRARGRRSFQALPGGRHRRRPALVGGGACARAPRRRDRGRALARGAGDAEPRAQPDPARIPPHHRDRHRRRAAHHRARLSRPAGRRGARGGFFPAPCSSPTARAA